MSRLRASLPIITAALAFLFLVLVVMATLYKDYGEWWFYVSAPAILALVAYSISADIKWDSEQSRVRTEKKIEQIEVKAEQELDKTKFAWELARVKLEAYFDRNLSQVRMIFVVAAGCDGCRFCFCYVGRDVISGIRHDAY